MLIHYLYTLSEIVTDMESLMHQDFQREAKNRVRFKIVA